MYHPLTPDLSNLTLEELHTKRADLQNKLMFASRMGQGDMIQQLNLVIGDYDLEIEKRNQKMLADLESKSGKKITDKIDITK